MTEKEQVFNLLTKEFKSLNNGEDRWVYPNIPKNEELWLRDFHQISDDESIIYYRDINPDVSSRMTFVITDVAIYFRWRYKSPFGLLTLKDQFAKITFKEMETAEYHASNNSFGFYGETGFGMPRKSAIKKEPDNVCDHFAKTLAEAAKIYKSDDEQISELVQRLKDLLGEDSPDYSEAIETAQTLKAINESLGCYWLAITETDYAVSISSQDSYGAEEKLVEKHDELIDDALHEIKKTEKLISSQEGHENFEEWVKLEKAWIYTECDNRQARKLFIDLLKSSNEDIVSSAEEGFEYSDDWVFDSFNKSNDKKSEFCDIEAFSNRQFIFIVKDGSKIAGCYDPQDDINWVFTLDRLPEGVSFPVGHPQANTLYIAHPAKKGYYLPYEGAEDIMFHDKVNDFCRLAQCLGATEITFNSVQGKSVSEIEIDSMHLGVDGGKKEVNASGSYSKNSVTSSEHATSKEIGISYVYQPTRFPYSPDGLPWLEEDSSWKSLVKQRLEGNILNYTKRISSSETTNLSSSKKNEIKATFNAFMFNLNANYDESADRTFSSSESTVWEISVKFKSLEDFGQGANSDEVSDKLVPIGATLTDADEKYEEEVLFILEDGEISESERRLLERKRIKLGVTEERAAEIEASCKPSLIEAEKEYLEIYKELVGDSEITDRKRRMLDREAESLGITPERVGELESKSL